MASSSACSSTTTTQSSISHAERNFLLQGIRDNCRVDGRSWTEWRRTTVTTGVLPLSHGSARCGSCLCSVKAELNSSTGRSVIRVHVDQQPWPLVQECLELALGPSLSLGESAAWVLQIDVSTHVTTHTTSKQQQQQQPYVSPTIVHQCIRYALADTVLPQVSVLEPEEGAVHQDTTTAAARVHLEDGEGERLVPSVDTIPYVITIHIVDHQFAILDATREESLLSSTLSSSSSSSSSSTPCRVHVAVLHSDNKNVDSQILGVSTTGVLPLAMMDQCIPLAMQAVPSLNEAFRVNKNKGGLRCFLPHVVQLE